jgi:transposase-like protein
MAAKTTASAGNAVTHGLTSKTIFPAALAEAVDRFRAALFAELKPQTPLDEILVSRLAHHAAAMQMASSAEAAALRTGEQHAAAIELLANIHGDDLRYVSALSSDMVERTVRYRRGHERSFFSALNRLTPPQSIAPSVEVGCLFESEDQCEEYLTAWQRRQRKWRCPRCQAKKRRWLHTRHSFECAVCNKQYSTRFGTLYAKSRAPLLAWFLVVEKVVAHPQITAAELAKTLPVTRQATVKMLIGKVTAALASNDAERLLAGVHRMVADHYTTWAKCSGPPARDKTKKSLPTSGVGRSTPRVTPVATNP